MCDYSLMSFPNRLAREGEELVVHRFACGAMGLASPADLQPDRTPLTVRLKNVWSDLWGIPSPRRSHCVVAVCIPPGAYLRVWDIPDYLQREIDIRRTEEVTFTQITASPFRYRDAIRFRNGHEILLQRLEEGQRVRILSLSVADFADLRMELDDRADRRQPPVPLTAAAGEDAPGINHVLFSVTPRSLQTSSPTDRHLLLTKRSLLHGRAPVFRE
jgi:hypothetical protein